MRVRTPRALAAVGISDQRETTVVWSRRTGRPVHNAIVWQDTRTAEAVERLAAGGVSGADRFRALTGLPISTYSSALKLAWILERRPDASRRRTGDLLFGTIDSWLIWQLTGGVNGGVHVTDVTNASRTMLMGLESLAWEPELLEAIGIPAAMLPEIRSLVRGLWPRRRRPRRRADLGRPRRPARGPLRPGLLRGRPAASAPTGPAASC